MDTPVQLRAAAITPISDGHRDAGSPTSSAPSSTDRPVRYTVNRGKR